MAESKSGLGSSGLAPAALEGFKNAAAYDAHRPAYPPEAVGKLLEKMGLLLDVNVDVDVDGHNLSDGEENKKMSRKRIVEIAAGTGKFTEALITAAGAAGAAGSGGEGEEEGREEGFEILATEPHPEMLRELEGKRLPGVVVRRGGAEELGSIVFGEVKGEGKKEQKEEEEEEEEGWADGVIAAQAFHWFATDQVLGEIHKVLKPGGAFGMIWNIDDYNKPKSWKASTQWAQHLNDWIFRSAANGPNKRFRDMVWKDVFTNQLKTNPLQVLHSIATHQLPKFSVPLGEDVVGWTHWLSEEALWKRINTLGHVVLLEGEERKEGERVFREAMAMEDVVRNEKGEVECHGRTYFAWTDRM